MKWTLTMVGVLFYSALLPTLLWSQSNTYPGILQEDGMLVFESIEVYQQTIELLRIESQAYSDPDDRNREIPCETEDPVLEHFEQLFNFYSLRKEQLVSECRQLEAGRSPEEIARHWMFDDFVAVTLNPDGQVQVGNDVMYLYAPGMTYLVIGGDRRILAQLKRGDNPYTFPDVEVFRSGSTCSADFSFNASNNSNTVNFTYEGDPAFGSIDLLWEFGDGSTSTLQNPSHTYASAGTYEVCLNLEVSGENPCADRICKQVGLGDSFCAAAFFWNETGLPGQLCFNNLSNYLDDIETYAWNFGDGSPISNEENPCHTFICDKTYWVTLSITTVSGCTSSIGLPVSVNSNQCCGKKAEYSNFVEFNGGQNRIFVAQAQFNLPFLRWVVGKVFHYEKKANGGWKKSKANLKISLEGDVFLPGAAGCNCELPLSVDSQKSKDSTKTLILIRSIGNPFKSRLGEEWKASYFVNGNIIIIGTSTVFCD